MERYEHTQTGWWIYLPIIVLVVGASAIATGGAAAPFPIGVAPAIIVMLGAGAIFARLTTRVEGTAVSWYFGWGWPGGSIAMAEIASAEVTDTNLLEGFGIHWTIWHGWLWNVWGFRAVEITKHGGGRVTLGTDDPQGLCQAIERFRMGAA